MVGAIVTAIAVTSCNEDPAHTGDCAARILHEGVTYRPHNMLDQSAPSGRDLGRGEVLDCGTAEDAQVVDAVSVSSGRGVAPSVAVKVVGTRWDGVYVAEGVPRDDWPEGLSAP